MIRIGAEFREERKRQNLSLEEVALATKIKVDFLSAIENGDYKKLPGASYAHGFVRNYAKFLGLPVEKSLAIFRREFDEKKSIEILPRGLINQGEFSLPKFRIGRSAVLISAVLIVISLYLLFQYRAAFFNPDLKVESPTDNQTINSLSIEVKGKTDPNSTLLVEGEQVSLQPNGSFRKVISVFPGETTIDFQVENKFGRVTSVKRNIKVLPAN
ncbi:MAG: helix-turn-helix domain-containing protein [Candidatus Levybacteria bacterium]|nr:helix-turn-helix domain-containing protein [Candidatus Levybacteria bacterium]